MENTNSLINTVAAAAADISYVNGKLTISVDSGTFPSMDFVNIDTFVKVTGVAETLQTNTVTYTVANATTYEFSITQNVGAANQAPVTYIASYTSDDNATALEIANALVNQINAQTGIRVTASGVASPLTLAADAGFPFFTVQAISNVAVALVTTGVAARGIGQDLVNAGVGGAVVGNTYTTYTFDFYAPVASQMGVQANVGKNTHTLYVNQGDVDFAVFDTKLSTEILGEKNSTEFGAVTQITSTTTGVTLSTLKGLITTFTHADAAGASAAFTVTNTLVGASSNIRAYVVDYAGTFTTNGLPIVSVDNRTAGTFDVVVSNAHSANALSGVLVIGFEIVTVQ